MGQSDKNRKKRKRKRKYNDRYKKKYKKSKTKHYRKNTRKKKPGARMNRLDKINLNRFPEGFKTTILHEKPYIVKIRRLLNTEEIDTILSMAEGKFERSTIVVDGEMVLSNVRTSKTAFITDCGHKEEYSKPIDQILKKVCYLAGCKRSQIESMMVVKYEEGEEYYNHHDFFKPDHIEVIANGGQRTATFFCNLSSLDSEEGGETEFPLIGVKSKPSKGTAIFWWDTTKSGKLLAKTLHRGNPVKAKNKIKYGLNIWVRETGW